VRKKLRQSLDYADGPATSLRAYNSFDIVGDIAITKLPISSQQDVKAVAQAILQRHKGVKTVLMQASKVSGDYRLRKLICIGGENRTRTVHKESDCIFAVDVEKCYFSPRLSYERRRIAELVRPNEVVVNMFAGVGCFSILIAKRQFTAKVYSIDINSDAIKFMEDNIRINRVFGKVIPVFGDAKTVIANQLKGYADRIVMPLPEKAFEYLPTAVSALKPSGGWIYFHAFEHAIKTENPAENVKRKMEKILDSLGVNFEIPFARVVRSTGPNWWQLALDVHIS